MCGGPKFLLWEDRGQERNFGYLRQSPDHAWKVHPVRTRPIFIGPRASSARTICAESLASAEGKGSREHELGENVLSVMKTELSSTAPCDFFATLKGVACPPCPPSTPRPRFSLNWSFYRDLKAFFRAACDKKEEG